MELGTARVVTDLGAVVVTPRTAIVVATHGRFDEDALDAALRSEADYVSLVASPTRARVVLESLRARDIPDERLRRLKAPAGLDLGAVAPEEIAVSILAEIVERRRRAPAPVGGRGRTRGADDGPGSGLRDDSDHRDRAPSLRGVRRPGLLLLRRLQAPVRSRAGPVPVRPLRLTLAPWRLLVLRGWRPGARTPAGPSSSTSAPREGRAAPPVRRRSRSHPAARRGGGRGGAGCNTRPPS